MSTSRRSRPERSGAEPGGLSIELRSRRTSAVIVVRSDDVDISDKDAEISRRRGVFDRRLKGAPSARSGT